MNTPVKYTIVALLLIIFIYIIGCQTSKERLLNPPQKSAEQLLLPNFTASIKEPEDVTPIIGGFNIIYAPKGAREPATCRPKGGVNPMVWEPKTVPTTREEIVIEWTTRACEPLPSEFAFLLGSNNPMETPINLGQKHGFCWLLVNPDFALVPTDNGTPSILMRRGGVIRLRWTPHDSFAGSSWFLQLVVVTPDETPSGYLLSSGIQLFIGRK